MSDNVDRRVSAHRRNLGGAVAAAFLWFAAGPQIACASDISFIDQFKNLSFTQTGDGNTLSPNGAFYSADLNSTVGNAYTSVSLTYPGAGSPVSLVNSVAAPTDYHYQTASFANQAAMDAAFPFGTYQFADTGASGDTASYAYAADDYALSNPFLTGTDYSSLQGMDPTQAFTFHISTYTTGGSAAFSYLFFTIYDYTTAQFVFNDGFLAPTTASIVLPANTLTNGHNYAYEVDFSNRDILPSPGAASNAQLGFDLRTDGTFSTQVGVPEPSTLGLFACGLFSAWAFRRRRA